MKAFISYSHRDEHYLERLKVHLAPMRREGIITDWADKDIYAGSQLDKTISDQLDGSTLFIALISPDYLASDYCYEKEFDKAMSMQKKGTLTIVPIILQPCEWKQTPFSKMKALPKDGKAISNWTNENNAYLDILNEIRRLVEVNQFSRLLVEAKTTDDEQILRNYRVKKHFSKVDSFNFKEESFNAVKNYFMQAVREIDEVENLQARFTNDDTESFTCLLANRANSKSSFVSVAIGGSQRNHMGDLRYEYSQTMHQSSIQMDKIFNVENDDYELYWTQNDGMNSYIGRVEKARYSSSQVAEIIWDNFIQQVGVSIERE